MALIGFQFCPRCGDYWSPRSQGEARAVGKQFCRRCKVRVQYSWLGHLLLCLAIGLLLYTGEIPFLRDITTVVVLVLLTTAGIQGVRQYLARQRFGGEQ